MKTTRISAFLCAAMFAVCMSAFAMQGPPDQGPPDQGGNGQQQGGQGQHGEHHGPPNVDDQIKHLAEKLNLSSDQQSKIKTILTDMHKQMESLHHDDSMSSDDKMEKMHSLHDATTAKIRGVLNDDQKKQFEKMEQERREHMQQGRQHENQGQNQNPNQN
jgi:Spy/CpxP family protein refolding chaperone